jgi:hypothetical protein
MTRPAPTRPGRSILLAVAAAIICTAAAILVTYAIAIHR